MARVVRVSPIRGISDRNKAELRRVFASSGTLVSLIVGNKTPDQLVEEVRHERPDAVFIDTVPPPHNRVLRALADELSVLEVVWQEQHARDRFGQLTTKRVAVGIGRRDAHGDLRLLADGELGS